MALGRQQLIGRHSGQRDEMEPHWNVCRTLMGGTPAMRKAGGLFTPETARERKEPALYNERLQASVLLDAYEAAVKRIASAPFEKPPTVVGELPWQFDRIYKDADRMGNSLSVFGAQIYQDAVDRGMGMFLVDNVPTVVDDATKGEDGQPVVKRRGMRANEVETFDARPYFVRIDPDNFVGAQFEVRNGREFYTELRVREWAYKPDPNNQFRELLVERVRVFTGTEVELWERNYGNTRVVDATEMAGKGDSTGYTLIEGPHPTDFPDGEIPLVVVYTNKIGTLHARPPMLGLAWQNVEHWNLTSIHKNALRYCLSPVLFGKGMSSEDRENPPKTGEGARLITTSETAELRFVEIAGTSLSASERLIDKNESRMRVASVEHLQQGSATATGEVRAEMRAMSEAQRWVEAMEWALYYAYGLAAKWVSATSQKGYELPDDFNITLHRASSVMLVANPARTQALQADVQAGRLTHLTYLKERKRSGDFADDFDPEAEAAAVQAEKAHNDVSRILSLVGQIEDERQPKPADGDVPPNKKPEPKAEPDPEAVPA